MASSKLKALRESMGRTQQEFAEDLGVTRACISNYEIGRREPDSSFFAKLKDKYHLTEKAIGEIILEYAKKKLVSADDESGN